MPASKDMNRPLLPVIGLRLGYERDRLGLTQVQLAEVAGVKIRAQQNYEGGKRAPNAEYILRLHEAGVDILFVLTGKRTPKAAPELPRLHSHDKTISATTAEAILKLIIPGKQKDADWYPGTDMPFVVSNVGNAQDGLNMVVFVCIDASLPEHVVARPVFLEVANVQPPVMLPRSRFRFSPGDAAVAAMGLKDAVTRVIKLRNQQQSTSLDA